MEKEYVNIPFGLKNYAGAKALREFSEVKQFPYSGLWLFTGSQGFGKTLLLMHVLREMIKEYPESIVVSNISIFGLPCIPFKGVDDFEKYHNGDKGIIFVLDEIHTLFNSLESRNMPLSTMEVWAQNRKNRRVILATSQRFSRVAKGIREQTKLLYVCHSPFLCFRRYACFDASFFDEAGVYNGPKERVHWYVPRFDVLTGYNTLEVVSRQNFYLGDDSK